MPEQIQLHGARPTMAALIDIWGRPHRLDPRTLVGRQVDGQGLAILEPSVSRHHAHLTLDNDEWTVRDLGSANGTFQDDKLISAPVAVHEGDRVRFGHIAFYFVEDVAAAAAAAARPHDDRDDPAARPQPRSATRRRSRSSRSATRTAPTSACP